MEEVNGARSILLSGVEQDSGYLQNLYITVRSRSLPRVRRQLELPSRRTLSLLRSL